MEAICDWESTDQAQSSTNFDGSSSHFEFHVTEFTNETRQDDDNGRLTNTCIQYSNHCANNFNYYPNTATHGDITMTGRGGGGGRRVLLPPINFLFRLLQQHTRVQIWLYEQLGFRIVGTIRVCNQLPFATYDWLC